MGRRNEVPPPAARLLCSAMYMDDILASLELRKWVSNRRELLSDVDHLEKHDFDNADSLNLCENLRYHESIAYGYGPGETGVRIINVIMLAGHSFVMSYGASSCADHYKQMTVNTESERNIETNARIRSGTHEENDFWKLGIISRQLNEACNRFEKVFGFQVFVNLGFTVVFFVTSSYRITVSVSDKKLSISPLSWISLLHLLNSVTVVTVMAVTSQKVKSRMQSIYNNICRLNLRTVADNHRYTYTRDLLRMWSQQARALRCFAGIPLAMPCCPRYSPLVSPTRLSRYSLHI
ncbi:hypothetical protein EVAR_81994_1 [Eumeta japonica]|uniref:Gustatory receptor n=1 Tax=Eumeta variegata TaxID=151549 RepID=A0A4C1VX82_EUMVA|nr:hypothetical protein EVAR_81994_1 [Eumeta japonica]